MLHLPLIDTLIDRFLCELDICEVVDGIQKVYRIIEVESETYCLSRFSPIAFPCILFHSLDFSLRLRNGHHYIPVIHNIIKGEEVDFQYRCMVFLNNTAQEVERALGISARKLGRLYIKKNGYLVVGDEFMRVPTKDFLQHKMDTDSFFYISDELRTKFRTQYARFALMQVRKDLWVEIDDYFHILSFTLI